jgi:hypothetical protein
MANQLPPVLVTFDADVLMAGRTQVWQEYAKVGSCYLPEVVYDEIDYLTGKAVEKAQEQVAREFMRFFADSGWIVTDAQETHRALEPSIKNQSAQAMLVVATAQCVYGLAQEHPEALVVFVSNSQPLLKRISSVGAANLCGITAAMLLNWARKGERPPAATQQLQSLMRTLADRQSTQRSNSRIQNSGVGKTGTSTSQFTMRGDSELKSPSSSTKTNQTGLSGSPRATSRAKKPARSREESRDYEPGIYRIKHITPPKKRDGGFLSGAFNLLRVFDVRGFRKTFVPALPQPVQQFVKSIDPK